MDKIVSAPIEAYCRQHTAPLSPVLETLIAATHAQTTAPQMLSGHLEGTLLRFLVQLTHAHHVLEIGTFTGFSALAMAEGLPPDGRIITCDVNPESTAIAREYWAQSPHGQKIELRLAPALETLATLSGPFDLVFIDADKANYAAYWEAVVPKVRAGGLIAVDNVLWSGRVLDPQAASDRAIADFNRQAAADARVETLMLSIRDGLLLGRKREDGP